MLTDSDRRHLFPGLDDIAYLNTAAEGIPPLTARGALDACHAHKSLGMAGRERLFAEFEACRASAAGLFGLSSEEVTFCSSTSEAYNLLATAIDFRSGDRVVISDLDFPSGATPWLQAPGDPRVDLWCNREGVLELDDLAGLLGKKVRLVQVSLVSFLTGHRIRWEPFRDLVRERAPDAILAVDVTQAAGRVQLDCLDADCLFASTYKWLLGSHGGCVVAVPHHAAERVTVRAGGWYHLANAFDEDRFTRAEPHPGARGFTVGMPAFPAVYALRAGLDCLQHVGLPRIAAHADALVARVHEGLAEAGIRPLSPPQPEVPSGIVAFRSERDAELHEHLEAMDIHVMHQAGRLRVSVHGYNREDDVERFLEGVRTFR